jgi:glycosyltransferase involved in cell wall biosynthesis
VTSLSSRNNEDGIVAVCRFFAIMHEAIRQNFSVCLVTSGHLGSNPRLVKEADALYEDGFRVCVVALDVTPSVRPLDQSILDTSAWQCSQVNVGDGAFSIVGRLFRVFSRKLVALGLNGYGLAVWAHHRSSYRLAREAVKHPADVYIAHNLAALPAAAIAAQHHGAILGFDAEDFHTGELEETPENATELKVRSLIENTLLPKCSHLTAASQGIADAYRESYGIEMIVIKNVFQIEDSTDNTMMTSDDRMGEGASLYWFSQQIGPGRGLEFMIRVLAKMNVEARLHFRGTSCPSYANTLRSLAESLGVGDRLHLMSKMNPRDMVRLAACHDVGLSVEPLRTRNRAICLTNKIFTYLLAGIPQLLTRTPAQQALADDIGEAGILVDQDDVETAAARLDALLSDRQAMQRAREKAWRLGREYYNWESEKLRFLTGLRQVLNRKVDHGRA